MKDDEARDQVKVELELKQRELVGEDVDTIDECHMIVHLGGGELIHIPVWFVHYNPKKENYAIAVDGSTGKVLGGGRPHL